MGLEGYSDDELQAELRRRKKSHKPQPVFRCDRCGEVGFYLGHFTLRWFEIQADQFAHRHRDCPPLFGGGGI